MCFCGNHPQNKTGDLNIPADVDADKIEAVCKDGVLSITLPKAEKAKAVKVKVKEQ